MSGRGAAANAGGPVAEGVQDASTQREEPSSNLFVRGWRAYELGLGAIVGAVARSFGRLGALTARRPLLVLTVSMLVAAVACLGWIRFRLETEADVLWVPQKGKARDDQAYVEANYPRSKEGASFYAQLNPSQYAAYGGESALQIPVTWEMFQLHNKIMNITVTGDSGRRVTYADLCLRKLDGTCDTANGYLWYFYKDFNVFLANISGSPTNPLQGDDATFRRLVSSTTYPDGEPVSLLSVFGKTTFTFSPTFQITSAKVIASDYTLDDSVSDATAEAWHKEFTALMKAELPKQRYMTFTWITGSSVGEELEAAINGDIMLVIISLIVFILIAVLFLSKWDAVKTRTSLALAGVFVTAMGIISGWGWGMMFGMPFTPLQQLSPFILLGVGVDVLLVLAKSYEIIVQREPWLTLPEALSKLMSTAGLSAQVALLTSAVAFALGSIDDLNSVRWFSAFATLNTVMILFLMSTAFIAFLALIEKRAAANRWDLLCCIKRAPAAAVTASPADVHVNVSPAPNATVPPAAAVVAGSEVRRSSPSGQSFLARPVHGMALDDNDIKDETLVKRFFRKYYAAALSRWWVKVLIALFFAAWMAASFVGITQVQHGQPLSDLAPDGSYLQDYDTVQQNTYNAEVGAPVNLYFRDVDVSDPAIQYKMLRAWDLALQDDFVNASTSAFLGNWLVDFTHWAQQRNATVALPTNNCYNPLVGKIQGELAQVITPVVLTGCVPKASFYTLLDLWLAGGTNNNLLRRSDGTIRGSRMAVMLTAAADNDKYNSEMIASIRDLEDQLTSELFAAEEDRAGDYVVFVYQGNFVFAEGDAILPRSFYLFCILALIGVGVVCLFMLVNPLAALLMMVAVGTVILLLFSTLWALDIRFNQVSVINFIMATGLSTDYSVYFAQSFMTLRADGTGNGRMRNALADTGSSVFLGGLTALLGSVPMAFATSVIIRTFFRLIFSTILFALAVGLVLMPVIFSTLAYLLPPIKSALVVTEEEQAPASGDGNSPRKPPTANSTVPPAL